MSQELTVINNIQGMKDLIPSIVDYAINIGIPEISQQWINYLLTIGDLTNDVHMKSVWGDWNEYSELIPY